MFRDYASECFHFALVINNVYRSHGEKGLVVTEQPVVLLRAATKQQRRVNAEKKILEYTENISS